MEMRDLLISLAISSIIFTTLLTLLIPASPDLNNAQTNQTISSFNSITNSTEGVVESLQGVAFSLQSSQQSDIIFQAFAMLSQFVLSIGQLLFTIITLPIVLIDAIFNFIIVVLDTPLTSPLGMIITLLKNIIAIIFVISIVVAIVEFISGRHLQI